MHKLSCAFLLAAALGLAGCHHAAAPAAQPTDPLRADIDTAVSPAQDFFTYANGGWLKAHPIPASESSWGIGNEVQDEIWARLRTISESDAKANPAAGSDAQKIGDFWATAMNTAQANQLGLQPIEPYLKQIAAIQTVPQALAAAAALRPIGLRAFFGMQVGQDEKNSTLETVHLGQGGLGLPNRDFYFSTVPSVVKLRDGYQTHLGAVLEELGEAAPQATRDAAAVMKFETALAEGSRTDEQLQDPYKNYNPMTPQALTARYTPGIRWREELTGWDLPAKTLIVGQPEFFTALQGALRTTPVPVLRNI